MLHSWPALHVEYVFRSKQSWFAVKEPNFNYHERGMYVHAK